MSYRMYIASHSKQSSLEKTQIFSQVILPDMQKDDVHKTYFANYECLEKFGCTDELELNKEPVIRTILQKCPSYLPKELLRNYPDYLPQSSNEENYIGLLTPELLWEYIQKLHQTQITELKQKLQQCQAYNAEVLKRKNRLLALAKACDDDFLELPVTEENSAGNVDTAE